ncbi:asparagine synthase-related protein [Dyadobacter sp. CY343]|uniref:asparagine synthase-related protein n=1 Tax=Dyadobacter sp. CY343 TaxID=2907299 RepID=UPI001F1D900F|nr:asparagine synthase-related protein [Dyadobacter sp. CY343]MCE7058570.1 asparagine synthase-related protein [Dyadobacter sp. CY343]
MLIEGVVVFQENLKDRFRLSKSTFDKSIELEHFFLGTKDIGNDAYEQFLLSSTKKAKENTSICNFLHIEVFSFDIYKQILSASDNKLRLAIWYDEANYKLHLARELFGTIPLYYIHIPGEFLFFSTSLSSIAGNKALQGYLDPNESMIVTYHRFRMDLRNSDYSRTFYSQVQNLAPGHILSVSRAGESIERHISFNNEKWAGYSKPEDFSPAIRDIFSQSVSASASDESLLVASHLSGGLDSSSVSTMFKHIYPSRPLHTIYHRNDSKEMDESLYSRSVVSKIGSIHHEVRQSDDDFDLIQLHTSLFGEPEVSTLSPSLITSLMPYARNLGCSILLRGSAGDSVIGSGMEILNNSFREKKWADLKYYLGKRVPHFSLAKNYPDWDNYSFERQFDLVLQNFLYHRFSESRNKPAGALFALYNEVNNALGVSKSYFMKRAFGNIVKRWMQTSVAAPQSILRDEYLQLPQSEESGIVLPRSLRGDLDPRHQEYFEDVFTPRAVTATEQQFVLGEYYGVKNRAPFLDKQLFEICMMVPDSIKYGSGKGREHFREAMRGLLSDEVMERSSKATLASSHGQKITLRLYEQAKSFLNDSKLVWEYVDRRKFDEQVSILKNDKIPYPEKVRTWFHVTRTITLASWLEWLAETKNQAV